ncbi:MAG: hypothetical protein WA869_04145 [Alloacidobacterium sp.]|jgi:hypothetical protein
MRLRAQAGFILFAVVTATITEAQNAPNPQQPQLHGNAAGVKSRAGITQDALAPSPEVPQVAPSLLDQPAKPAQVQLDAGKLSVQADNSTLSGIIHDISSKTGMTVDGLSRDQRIFGSYGPAAPREVLSALLEGLGYNVMMVGALGNGAPRLVTLTPRTSGGAATGNPPTPAPRQNNDDEDDSATEQQDNQLPPRPEPNPPEAEQPPGNPGQPGQPGQVKTPQQMLQELQQMRQQQQQQQQLVPQ